MKRTTYNNRQLFELLETIKTLRGPTGCPWDRKQTASSLIKYLQSECEELVAAIQKNDHVNICEELGDLLYVLLMITEIHSAADDFQLTDVLQAINEKLIRRHPHVFAGQPYENEEQLKAQWQAIKREEKKKNTV